jgi:hypothetical protein
MPTNKDVCSDANEILKKWLDKRKKSYDAEEKILSSLLNNEPIGCIPLVAKQLKQFFDTDIDKVIKESIEMQIEKEKPHEIQTPEKPAGEMRGWKEIIKTATSEKELDFKFNEAINSINKVYSSQPKMQELWRKRINTIKDETIKKIERKKNT